MSDMTQVNLRLATASYPSVRVAPLVQVSVYLLAFIIVIMVTAQLMTYEKFVPIIDNYFFGSVAITKVFTASLLLVEVLSLPFLLRMSLSPLFRVVSTLCLLLTGGMWVLLGLRGRMEEIPIIGSGIFGSLGSQIFSAEMTIYFSFFLSLYIVYVTYVLRKDLSFTHNRKVK